MNRMQKSLTSYDRYYITFVNETIKMVKMVKLLRHCSIAIDRKKKKKTRGKLKSFCATRYKTQRRRK